MEVEAPSLPSWTGLSMEEVEAPTLSPCSGLSLGVGVREEGREAARLMLGSRLRGVEGAEFGDWAVLWPSLVLLLQGLQWGSRTEEGHDRSARAYEYPLPTCHLYPPSQYKKFMVFPNSSTQQPVFPP